MAKRNMNHLKAVVEAAFIEHGKTARQLAAEFDISENTISKWRREGGWDETRNYIRNAPHRLERKLLEELESITDGGEPSFNADALSKVKAVYNAIKKEVDPPAIYSVLTELNQFAATNFEPGEMETVAAVGREFLRHKIEGAQ